MAERAEGLGQPGAGNGLAPGNVRLSGSFVPANAGAGQEAHRLAERQAIIGRATLDRLKLIERAAQSLPIDLGPLAANPRPDEPPTRQINRTRVAQRVISHRPSRSDRQRAPAQTVAQNPPCG